MLFQAAKFGILLHDNRKLIQGSYNVSDIFVKLPKQKLRFQRGEETWAVLRIALITARESPLRVFDLIYDMAV